MGSRCFNDDSKLPSESAWLGRRLLARSCSIHFYPRCMFFRRSIGFVDAHRLGWHFMDSLITSHLCTGRAVTVAGGDYLQKAPGITDGDCQAVGFGKCFTFSGVIRWAAQAFSRYTDIISTIFSQTCTNIYILLTSNLGLVGHTRQFQKPMSSRLIQHWHFLLRPMSSGHNHDIHRNMYEVFKEAAPAKTHSRTLCHHCVTRVPGSGI